MPRRLLNALSRPGRTRAVAIAVLTLFVGSAVLTPTLNPWTRRLLEQRFETDATIAFGWTALNQTRADLAAEVQLDGDWPDDLDALGAPLHNGVFAISSPEPWLLRVRVADDAPLPAALRGTEVLYRLDPDSLHWQCTAGLPPLPDRYLPLNCRGAGAGGGHPLLGLALLLLAAGLAVALVALLRHPLLAPVLRRPSALLSRPVEQLARIDRLLGWLHRRDAVLQAARIDRRSWQQALQWPALPPAQRLQQLAARVEADGEPARANLPGALAEWRLPAQAPVGVERCRVYLPDAALVATDLLAHLRADSRGHELMLVLPHPDQQADVRAFCADPVNAFVCIDAASVTALLLSPRPLDVLVRLLASQLRVTRISPYQTRGGVARPASFFGRERLLARILGREPENYLLVGGRQLGKTSLMKAVERQLREHPRVHCHYLSLRDHRLAPRLALSAGLPPDSTLDAAVERLLADAQERSLLLLIDECDLMVRDEAARGYPQLAALRALSEEGRCHFMLAGFWDLYAATTLDYQSPLRNFGEVIALGSLEHAACRELATVPLARLGVHYASAQLIERIVEISGERANLVALLCQECLQALPVGSRVIDAGALASAERAASVQDALGGWARLSHDERGSRIDRIVVYALAARGSARLDELAALLTDARIDIEALRLSLVRLQLAYIVLQQGEHYRFAVPLFAELLRGDDVDVLLAHEREDLLRACTDER